MKKRDDLLELEYSAKAAEQSRARGSQPTPPAQPKQRKVERVMRADPTSLKKIDNRAELLERVRAANPDVPVSSITGGKAKKARRHEVVKQKRAS